MLRIAICEDKQQDTLLLRGLLEEYLGEHGLEGTIDTFETGEAMLDAHRPGRYHITFLDIYLDGLDGMEAARKLREQDDELAIVFLTVSEAHAIESYAVRAAYYLSKATVNYQKLSEAMRRCGKVVIDHARSIEVPSNRSMEKVRLRDVLYIETYRHRSIIYMAEGSVKTSVALDVLEEQMRDGSFFRCHRSFLINLRRIRQLLEKEIVMEGDVRIPIGGTYANEFRKQYRQYMMALGREMQMV